MLKKPLFTLAIILFLGSFIFWRTLAPSITPNDVIITGNIINESNQNSVPDNQFFEVHFDKKTDKPLYVSEDYFYNIIFVARDKKVSSWQFTLADGSDIEEHNIVYGTDIRTLRTVNKKLGGKNIYLDTNISGAVDGFAYVGREFPLIGRLYLYSSPSPVNNDKECLIYAHYEVRFGKDLSWAKVIPLNALF